MCIYTVPNLVNDWVHVVWWNAYYINWESHNIFYEWTICVRRDFRRKSLQKGVNWHARLELFWRFPWCTFWIPRQCLCVTYYYYVYWNFLLFHSLCSFSHQFCCQLLCTIVHKNSILTLTPSTRWYLFCVYAMTMPCLCSPQVINT